MKRLLPFAAGLVLGFLCVSRRRQPALVPLEMEVEVDELASPSIFRGTVRLRSRPVTPVSKGARQAA